MSGLVTGKVWFLDFRTSVKATLAAMADHAHDDGTSVYPSADRIAAKTGQHRVTVANHIREAEESGVLVRVGWKPRGVVEWRFDMEILEEAERPGTKNDHTSLLQL